MAISVGVNVAAACFVWRYRETERRTFLFSLLLLYFNMQYTFVVLPLSFISCIAREWIFGEGVCILVGGIRDSFMAGNFIMLMTLTVDHFLTVFAPFFYARHGKKMAVGLFLSPFLVSVIRFVVFASLDCIAYIPTHKMCSISAVCGTTCTVLFFLLKLSVKLMGILMATVLCSIVYAKLRRLDKKAALSEENRKQLIDRKIFYTFVWLMVSLIGKFLIGFMLSFVYYLSSPQSIGPYLVQSILGHTLASCITFTNTAIIFHVLLVRDSLRKNHQTVS